MGISIILLLTREAVARECILCHNNIQHNRLLEALLSLSQVCFSYVPYKVHACA